MFLEILRIFRAPCFQLYSFSCTTQILFQPSLTCAYLFVQMAAPALLVFDEDGRAHSECTHWQGFPNILWKVMRDAGYPSPPRYVGEEFHEMGVARCRVRLTHAPHPFPAHWASLELEVVGHRLVDTWEIAAMRALNKFCEKNYAAVTLAPIGLFPAEQPNDPNWLSRVGHTRYLQQNRAAETISMSMKCMNALYRLQTLQAKAMAQIIGSTWTSHEIVTARNEQIADLDAHIGQLEGQVEERDALLDERDADFALLEQESTAQQFQLNNALDHIEMLEDQQAQPEAMEEETQEVQCILGLDTTSGVPMPPLLGAHSPVRSESSVNNLDDF